MKNTVFYHVNLAPFVEGGGRKGVLVEQIV